ncbi:MAG: acetyl/propionyl/methylcrotonyl-CoA carboxylase subunit alpha [Acidimicrobiales bacterium]
MSRIRTLLIANRGEIAARIIRSAHALDIETIAVFSDADAHAPYVSLADRAVALHGNAPSETYLDRHKIIEAARLTGADAIHPGYGFLSENASFAQACADAGICFVGPPPAAIAAMGSKVAAKEMMAAAGVPVLPGISIAPDEELSGDLLAQASDGIGYPILVKAAFGGGGRGMRAVTQPDALLESIASARREAASAFGDGTVFLEHYVESPRHIEVQIFADTQGNTVHLFERECSIQRRFQKIIEEAPSPAVSESQRAELGQAAVAAAKAMGYIGAGTVEFVMGRDGRFFFLEVNTRLQVEHPVTEMITGLDLVKLQLQVAEGKPLPPEAHTPMQHGHAIEVRLYAEDVEAGFLPATGRIHRFVIPEIEGIRVDAGVTEGSEVGVHYDPMLAKIIAWGADRDEARRRLARALAHTELYGVTSNRELLVGILREEEFAAGSIDTAYLVRHEPAALVASVRHPLSMTLHSLAAALAAQARRRAEAPTQRTIPSGWRNVHNAPQLQRYRIDGTEVEVHYSITRSGITASTNGEPIEGLILWDAHPDSVDLEFGGVRYLVRISIVGDSTYVQSGLGTSLLEEVARFPEPGATDAVGSLVAPMPGTVVRVEVSPGERVAQGTPVVVLEAMKMEHTVRAPHDGTVTEVRVGVGEAVDVGAVMAVMEEA